MLAQEIGLTLITSYIAGQVDTLADFVSKILLDPNEWMLKREVFLDLTL